MNPVHPGIAPLRLLRALVFLFAVALGFATVPDPAGADSGTIGPAVLGLHWETVPSTPCVGEIVSLRFTMCECVYDLAGAAIVPNHGLSVYVARDSSVACVTCDPDTAEVVLGPMQAPGTHLYTLRIVLPPEYSDSLSTIEDYIVFPVAEHCATPPGIPYLDRVVIGGPAPCENCVPRVCPVDSIDVFLAGTFPDDCTSLSNIELRPSILLDPIPGEVVTSTIRITYGTNSCLGRPCATVPVPWAARVRLPGIGRFEPDSGIEIRARLPIEAYVRDFCLPDSIGARLAGALFPFTVADSCSTSPPPPGDVCWNVSWRGAGIQGIALGNTARCAATWRPGGTTDLILEVGSRVPISGVEGNLRFDDAGALSITSVTAHRPGWEVGYSEGHFIAFAGPGTEPIPATEFGSPMPFLHVQVAHDENLRVLTPDLVRLAALDLVVSDPLGRGIPGCPVPGIYPGPNVATLCREARCDANADGLSDVRDLVVMVNCLAPPESVRLVCPVDSLSPVLDCDESGTFDLDDVFCCVRAMLNGDGSPDSARRETPEIAVRFGVPRPAGDGTLDVPMYFGGWSAVAAARLDVAYPDARYEVIDVRFADTPTSWWTIHEVSPGHARLAVLDLAALGGVGPGTLGGNDPVPPGTGETRVVLKLRLRDGASPGGELSIAASDFAAGDGVGLSTPNAAPRLALAGGTGIALSTARPNPFVASTAFALTIPTSGPVDVAVFAANGRRVATLLRESAAQAGVYDLAWDGRQDAGGRAPAGVYFVRVVTGPADAARKVLFLPGGAR